MTYPPIAPHDDLNSSKLILIIASSFVLPIKSSHTKVDGSVRWAWWFDYLYKFVPNVPLMLAFFALKRVISRLDILLQNTLLFLVF